LNDALYRLCAGLNFLKSERGIIDRRLLTILLIVFVQMVGASMANPILPLYAQSEFALDAEVITLLLTVFYAAQFIAGPFVGRLSDRRGRLPVLLLSQVGTAVSFFMIGFAQSAWILFLARLLDGITGGNFIVAQAYVTDIMPEEKRTLALGYVMAAFGLGMSVGPAVGGVLASQFGPQMPFVFAAVAAAVTVLLTYMTLEETLKPEDRERNLAGKRARVSLFAQLNNGPLLAVLSVSFISQFGFGLLIATFALFAEQVLFAGYDFGTVSLGVGIMLMVVGIGQFLTQILLLPAALKRFSDSAIVILGAALRGLSMFLLAVALEPRFATVAVALFAVGNGLLLPPLQSLATKTVAPSFRGGILGINSSVMSLGVIISTAVSGSMFAHDPAIPNWASGALTCLSILPGLFLWRWMGGGVSFRRQKREGLTH